MSISFNIPVSLFSFVVVQNLYVTYFDYLKENHLILMTKLISLLIILLIFSINNKRI